MWAAFERQLFLAGLSLLICGSLAHAQSVTELQPRQLSEEVLAAIGIPKPKLSPMHSELDANAIPVRIVYDGPTLEGGFTLTITISKRDSYAAGLELRPISQTTLYLGSLNRETDAFVTLPKEADAMQIKAEMRDENLNLVLETAFPLPLLSNDLRVLKLVSPLALLSDPSPTPEFTTVETISGRITLPRKSTIPDGSRLYVQLLENALAGGMSMQLAAQDSRPAVLKDDSIAFQLQRGIWETKNDPDLAFRAWISDPYGRKIFVMQKPVNYNGPNIDYAIALQSLKQGKNTKKGQTINPNLMAQTLVQGIAEFDPVNGIPGQARLKIVLKQDRGDYNLNPIVSEQVLLLRGMETRIPFNLATDSTHFDPYTPAPFLSVSLTDSFGRIYYTSGDIRAREGENFVRLYPR